MSADKKHVSLAADIARVLGGKRIVRKSANESEIPSRCLLVTGVALAIMQAQPANAVSLGELRVQSGLGQPFVGTTTARLGPGETIASGCVSAPGKASDGLGSPDNLTVSAQSGATPGNYPVQIRTTQPLYEPMYEIRLQIDCPGGVALSKSYVVMLNVPMSAPVEALAAAATTTSTSPSNERLNHQQANSVNSARRNTRATSGNSRLTPSRGAVSAGESYRVRNGDTLSVIAERVEGRPVGSTWRVAEMLFAANPHAFIRGNRDMIKLGAVLTIPTITELNGELAVVPSRVENRAANNDMPAASGGELVNVALGRPEENITDSIAENVSNEALLQEIREANSLSADSKVAVADTNEFSPFADDIAETVSADRTNTLNDTAFAADSAQTASVNNADIIEEPAGMSALTAALAGIFMGVLLALAMLGRSLLAPLLEGRSRRKAAMASAAAAAPAPEPTADLPPINVGTEPVRLAYGGGGIDVEVSDREPGDHPHAVDVDLFAGDEPAVAGTPAEHGNAPRVSLRSGNDQDSDGTHIDVLLDNLADDDSTDMTERFEAPALNSPLEDTAENAIESTDHTNTMRNLFEDGAYAPTLDIDGRELETVEMADSSESPTAEMPAVDADENDDTADIDITDLESLSRKLQETQNDKLSATLTQALGLLEKDYEEAMTASQILEQHEIDEAFSQHKSDD